MEKEFVPYDIALAMKELGFDEGCFGYYYVGAEGSIGLSHQIEGKGFQIWTNSLLKTLDPNTNNIAAPLYQQLFDYLMSFLDDEDFLIFYKNGNVDIALKKSEVIECENKDACLRKLIEIVKQNKDE